MKQYIDKAVLVAEIERRIKSLQDCKANTTKGYAGEISGLKRFLSFLDTLEVKEEPVSEDLEKAAGNYAFTMSGEDEVLKYYAFKAGAKWQETQMIDKMEQFLYEELSNGDIECRDMKSLIEYFKFYMKK